MTNRRPVAVSVAWFLGMTRMRWSIVLVLWIVVTLIMRYQTAV